MFIDTFWRFCACLWDIYPGNVCLQEAHKTVLVKCEQVSRRIEELRLKCEEHRKESAVMEDTVTAMPQVLEELQ